MASRESFAMPDADGKAVALVALGALAVLVIFARVFKDVQPA